MTTYWEQRYLRNKNYYAQATAFVRKYAPDAVSMIDVGNRGCEYIYKWDWIPDKTVLDLSDEIFSLDARIKKIQADFIAWKPDREYDLVTCFQTLEHIEDPIPFIKKLREIQKGVLIVSLPYMWPASKAPDEHKHDPIDMELIREWFELRPLEESIVAEDRGTERWMGVYSKSGRKARIEHPPPTTAIEVSV